ncbi:hypothetical protein [Vermiculatibacterium agrestimuris]|uniref:hypothetical protein n=1 Tax=Vermiculatibacterium agrestimuris TaxID=2941519 RepID=UPI00203C3F55|nr:hypothetical protein [Vermiculatibacterium agrestimuris]
MSVQMQRVAASTATWSEEIPEGYQVRTLPISAEVAARIRQADLEREAANMEIRQMIEAQGGNSGNIRIHLGNQTVQFLAPIPTTETEDGDV